jgi:hypothetical protein
VRRHEAHQLALPLEPGALKYHRVPPGDNTAEFDDEGLIEPVTVEKPEPPKNTGGQLTLF